MIRTSTVTVDGLNIRYLEAGSGFPVLLVHGASLGSSAEVWEDCLPRVAEGGYRAVAYDQPGYGLSDNPRDYGLSYRTAFITRFMDALGLERAALVGHSQAGSMAVRVALDRPERVAAVVAVCSGSLLPPPSGGGGAATGEAPASDPTPDDVRRMLQGDLFHKDRATPDAVERRHRLSTGKNVVAAVERSKAREPQGDGAPVWERLGDVPVPLLLLYGDHDRASAAQRAPALKEQHPGLDVRVVPEAAHLLMWDAPDAFAAGVLEVLSTAVAQPA